MTKGQDENDDFIDMEQLIGDGINSTHPYHNVLLSYLQSRERLSKVMEQDNEYSMM